MLALPCCHGKRAIARGLARLADLVENENVCPDFLLFRVEAIMANIGLVAAEMDTKLDPLVLENLERVAHQIGVSSDKTSVVSDHNYREVPENVEVETADCRVFQ